jgi:hypothetical protein
MQTESLFLHWKLKIGFEHVRNEKSRMETPELEEIFPLESHENEFPIDLRSMIGQDFHFSQSVQKISPIYQEKCRCFATSDVFSNYSFSRSDHAPASKT